MNKYTLNEMPCDAHGGLEIKSLFDWEIIEENLEYGGHSAPVIGPTKGESIEIRLLMPRESIFVLLVPLEMAVLEEELHVY